MRSRSGKLSPSPYSPGVFRYASTSRWTDRSNLSRCRWMAAYSATVTPVMLRSGCVAHSGGSIRVMRNFATQKPSGGRTSDSTDGQPLIFAGPPPAGWRHPLEVGAAGVEQYLTHLAVERHVAANTQNVAFNALVFLYRHVLKTELGQVRSLRACRPPRLPVVLTRPGVRRLLDALD